MGLRSGEASDVLPDDVYLDAHTEPDLSEDVELSPGVPAPVAAARIAKPARDLIFVTPLLVLLAGLLITATVAWSAEVQYRNEEHQLLVVQTRQAGDVLLSSIPATQTPLATAAQVADATGGSASEFRQDIAPLTGGATGFRSAALWSVENDRVTVQVSLGHPVTLSKAAMLTIASRALTQKTFVVVARLARVPRQLTYADGVGSKTRGFVVYASRALPANRHSRVAASSSAFSELRYAIYLGSTANPKSLLSTDLPTGPPPSVTAKVTVPFGDTSITLVASPTAPLAGSGPAHLPWILGVGGVLLSIAAALLALGLVLRRRTAEYDARKIAVLNHELSLLYAEQRTIAVALQRALLPLRLPKLDGLEICVRYLPGGEGAEIGGDWYSIVALDERHFGIVIGDVSGRGVRAAAAMAALRFTVRTLLFEGNPPPVALAKCADLAPDLLAGHLATVLVGVGDLEAGTITVANAGHLLPLLVTDGAASFVPTEVGPPIGVRGAAYAPTTFSVRKGSTLLLYTDGLVERRDENLEVGLQRLATAASHAPRALDDFVTTICDELTADSDDDIAMIALHWQD